MAATRKTEISSNPRSGIFLEPFEDIDGEFEEALVNDGFVHLVLRKRIELLLPLAAMKSLRGIKVGTQISLLRTDSDKNPIIIRRRD